MYGVRKPRDISLHRNRGIIDREVCSARQIDGRGENDDDQVETREGRKTTATAVAEQRSPRGNLRFFFLSLAAPLSPKPLCLFLSFSISRDARSFSSRSRLRLSLIDCCVLLAGWMSRMLEQGIDTFYALDIGCYEYRYFMVYGENTRYLEYTLK